MLQELKSIKYKNNPFQGLFPAEIPSILNPKFDLFAISEKLNSPSSSTIEFCGKKGRGKSTHLKMLKIMLPDAELLDYENDKPELLIQKMKSRILLIDGLSRVPLPLRWQLLKKAKNIVYTCHFQQRILPFLRQRNVERFLFKGLNNKELSKIIHSRLQYQTKNELPFKEKDLELYSSQLIQKHGDNIRAIINYLYFEFQQA